MRIIFNYIVMEAVKEILTKVRYTRKMNWLHAEKLLKENLKRFPQSVELSLELADLYFKKKYYRRSISVSQNALLFSDRDEFIRNTANCFLALREYHLSLNYFNRVKKETPEQLYNKAIALARLKRLDESIKTAHKVIEYNLKSPVPYILLAELHFNKKEFKKTIYYCDQAESITGLCGDICFLRGMAWMAEKNLLKAYWDFHLGEVFDLKNPDYYRSFGIVCEGIGKTPKAIELLLKAIKLAPGRPGAYLELLRIYLLNNMLEDATDLLQQARDSLPGDFPLTMMYNQIIDRLTEGRQ